MDPFEYVIVLTSLILGLGITQILIGVADVITNKNIKWSLPHAMMTTLVFLTQIQEWWTTYSYSMIVKTWTLPLIMMLMVYPILLFVAARVLFPYDDIENRNVDLEAYYWKKCSVIFIIFLLVAITSIWQNYVFSHIPIYKQLPQIAIGISYAIFILAKISSRKIHIGFLGLQILGWAIYLIQEHGTIGN
jgi:hypothetical protein